MTNQEKFIQTFGIDTWQQMIVFSGLAEQFKDYWTSPYNEADCRDCKEFEDCSCGKKGHDNGTSQGYSIGECEDFKPKGVDGVISSKEDIAKAFQLGIAFGFGKNYDEMDKIIEEVRKASTPKPERKLGIWTHKDTGVWICGVCGEEVGEIGDEYGVPKYNFCPYCGGDMTGKPNESEE